MRITHDGLPSVAVPCGGYRLITGPSSRLWSLPELTVRTTAQFRNSPGAPLTLVRTPDNDQDPNDRSLWTTRALALLGSARPQESTWDP